MQTKRSFISAAICGVLERLALHHVAPVAGGVADRDEDRLVLAARSRERLLAPRIPVDGFSACWRRYGEVSDASRLLMCRFPFHVPSSRNGHRGRRARGRRPLLARRQERRADLPLRPDAGRSGHRIAGGGRHRRADAALPGQPRDRRRGGRRVARRRRPLRHLRDRHLHVQARQRGLRDATSATRRRRAARSASPRCRSAPRSRSTPSSPSRTDSRLRRRGSRRRGPRSSASRGARRCCRRARSPSARAARSC